MTDGINNQGAFLSTYAVPPIIDTIQEFKVNSHNDQAEFGGALGGIINVVTKSGTNGLHGTAWEYLRNDAFDARNTFQHSVTLSGRTNSASRSAVRCTFRSCTTARTRRSSTARCRDSSTRSAANSFLHLPTDADLQRRI